MDKNSVLKKLLVKVAKSPSNPIVQGMVPTYQQGFSDACKYMIEAIKSELNE